MLATALLPRQLPRSHSITKSNLLRSSIRIKWSRARARTSAVSRSALPSFLTVPFSSFLKWVKRRLRPKFTDSERRVSDKKIVGRVKRVLEGETAFGFIAPESGGPDLYFNEKLLGADVSWAELVKHVGAHAPGTAPVLFEIDTRYDKPQAKGVVLLSKAEETELDADGDGHVSRDETHQFLAAHPEIEDAAQTKQEREYQKNQEENEAESARRDQLFQKQQAAENDIYEKRDTENRKAKELFDEAEKLWQAGEKDQAKKLQAEAKKHQERARQYKQQAVEMDWKHNEEMFEFVQTDEHEGQEQDGTWIDLHGLSADFAEHTVSEAIKAAKSSGCLRLEIITGAGNHSGKGGPMIKPRILEYLNKMKFDFQEENAGSFIVSIN